MVLRLARLVAALMPIAVAMDVVVSLHPQEEKCFSEEIAKHALFVASAAAVLPRPVTEEDVEGNPRLELGPETGPKPKQEYIGEPKRIVNEDGQLHMRVLDIDRSEVFSAVDKSQARTAFTTTHHGKHWVCVRNVTRDAREPLYVRLGMAAGGAARDLAKQARREHLSDSGVQIKLVGLELEDYFSDLRRIRKMTDKSVGAHESSASKAFWFAVLNIVVIIALGAVQLGFLKRHLKNKKIL